MLIGRVLLFIIMLSTFLIAALTTNLTPTTHQLPSSTTPNEQYELHVLPIQSSAAKSNECQEPCSIEFCLKHLLITRNCTKVRRDQCNCCTVCLRTEHEICGGQRNIYGLCEQDLLCYKANLSEQTGLCVKGIERSQF
jgi:hypothetical protein